MCLGEVRLDDESPRRIDESPFLSDADAGQPLGKTPGFIKTRLDNDPPLLVDIPPLLVDLNI